MEDVIVSNRRGPAYIAGRWQGRGAPIELLNPSTGKAFTSIEIAERRHVAPAVEAAAIALPIWRDFDSEQRAFCLSRMATHFRGRLAELADLHQLCSGKPRAEAEADILDSVAVLEYYSRAAITLGDRQNERVPYEASRQSSQTRFEPVGVAGIILPWNFPLKIASWKIGPALAAGCTVVIKPAPQTALLECEWALAAEAAGLPPGVLNILVGDGRVGAALCSHPLIRKISFTGSTASGIEVMKSAAEGVKNIGLELGGKSSILVFNDATPDLAERLVDEGIFYNSGQCCNATSRLLVQQELARDLMSRIHRVAETKVVAGPENPSAQMGPLTTKAQYEKVTRYLKIAEEEELTLLTGGSFDEDIDGFFVRPTIYTNVPASSRLWNEEIFGPVLLVRTFEKAEEAVAAANATELGLAASIVTEDVRLASQVAERLEAGHIFVNTSVSIRPETSWGGFKKSGIGRELGPWGLAGYLEVKTITSREFGWQDPESCPDS